VSHQHITGPLLYEHRGGFYLCEGFIATGISIMLKKFDQVFTRCCIQFGVRDDNIAELIETRACDCPMTRGMAGQDGRHE
jgi:hypothetical protein